MQIPSLVTPPPILLGWWRWDLLGWNIMNLPLGKCFLLNPKIGSTVGLGYLSKGCFSRPRLREKHSRFYSQRKQIPKNGQTTFALVVFLCPLPVQVPFFLCQVTSRFKSDPKKTGTKRSIISESLSPDNLVCTQWWYDTFLFWVVLDNRIVK